MQDLNINFIPLIEIAWWTDSESDSDEESDDQEEEEEKNISVESKQGIIDNQMLQESSAVLSCPCKKVMQRCIQTKGPNSLSLSPVSLAWSMLRCIATPPWTGY